MTEEPKSSRITYSGWGWAIAENFVSLLVTGAILAGVIVFYPSPWAIAALVASAAFILWSSSSRIAPCPNCGTKLGAGRKELTCPDCKHRLQVREDHLVDLGR